MTSSRTTARDVRLMTDLLARQVSAVERIARCLEQREGVVNHDGVDTIFKNVSILDLSVRAANILDAAGIKLIGDLIQLSEDQVGVFKNSGAKVISNIMV